MARTHVFGGALARIRQEQGFSSAHSFYQSRDGRRVFQMTFRNYLNVEQGRNLPKPERVEALVAALGIEEHSTPARELAEAYFADLGLTGLARRLGGHQKPTVDHDDAGVMEQTARQVLQAKLIHWSLEQWKLLADDFTAYVCDDLLQTTEDWFTLPELARQTGQPLGAVKRAVAAMEKADIARVSGGRVRSALDNKFVEAPPSLPAWVGVSSGLLKNQARVAEEGALVQNSLVKIRATEADLKRVKRHVDQLILLSSLYEKQKKSDDSAVYMVRAQVFKIFPRRG